MDVFLKADSENKWPCKALTWNYSNEKGFYF